VPRNSKAGCLAAQAKRAADALKYPQLRDKFWVPPSDVEG
jgi:hypothetical protein